MPTPPDAWVRWRELTNARIALGRAGGSLPTAEWLDFNLAHARAKDAVQISLDTNQLAADLTQAGFESVVVRSAARDRNEYLQRPDLGRRLAEGERERLEGLRSSDSAFDLVIIVADGLSAPAAQRHAVPLVATLVEQLATAHWTLAPVVLAIGSRVALQDEVGEALGARLALSLIGERPGLGSPDSLGAYLTYDPKPGRHDAQRNCVSNIRPEGLPIPEAVNTLFFLLTEARYRRLTGVQLKDTRVLEGASPTSVNPTLKPPT